MEVMLVESKASLSLRVDGGNEMDAKSLSEVISAIAEISEEVAASEDKTAYVKLNVTAFTSGSFQVNFSAICETAETLLAAAAGAVGLAGGIVGIIKGCFEIKKHLKGARAKNVKDSEGGVVEVENASGEKIKAPKSSAVIMQNNYNVNRNIIIIADNVREHNPSGGFSVGDEKDQIVFTSDDVSEMRKSIPIEEDIHIRRLSIQTDLLIKSPQFYGGAKWQFYHGQRKIDASIEDLDFLQSFQSTGVVRPKDFITATLRVETEIGKDGTEIEGSAKYFIDKVHGEIQHRPKQQAFSDFQ